VADIDGRGSIQEITERIAAAVSAPVVEAAG
jgi:hypothetical protein